MLVRAKLSMSANTVQKPQPLTLKDGRPVIPSLLLPTALYFRFLRRIFGSLNVQVPEKLPSIRKKKASRKWGVGEGWAQLELIDA